MQIVISVDEAGQMSVAAEGISGPAQALQILHGATGAVLQKLGEAAAAAGPPKPQILVPTGFSMPGQPVPDGTSGRAAVIKGR